MKKLLLLFFTLLPLSICKAEKIKWYDGRQAVTLYRQSTTDAVVTTAMGLFCEDMMQVTGLMPKETTEKKAKILLFQLDKASGKQRRRLKNIGFDLQSLRQGNDAFAIKANEGKVIIVGNNGRGTAYGLLELSRMAGVSPWVWWGDVEPERKTSLFIDEDFYTMQSASVEYRGIFLNDEDWSLRQWSCKNYEPGPKGQIGKNTHRRIFELLLRLRANAIWPAMHPGTTPFFLIPDAKAVADSCGIVIGTSHCEPMLRNNVGEWDEKQRGRFNYMTNRQGVQDYWKERLEEVSRSQNNMFTIGMRGIHDGNMEGVKTDKEKLDALQAVIDDQQKLLQQHIGDPESLTQVFVPYKEVLEIYDNGLRVPDYVTLMWCDDNYGYITRMSNSEEQRRKGGAGLYYHLSYWGRPHDYLWLTTTQPGLIYNELREAYDHNIKKIWIANVHDPKVASYDLELFLDMAWDIDCVKEGRVDEHYRKWLRQQFGEDVAEKIFPSMLSFYRLAGQRRPEFMGWTQVELDKKKYPRGLSPVGDTEFTHAFGDEMMRFIAEYERISEEITGAKHLLPLSSDKQRHDAYFTMIEYPVLSSMLMAKKILYAQKARELASDSSIALKPEIKDSINLYSALATKAGQHIITLTNDYNSKTAAGKWKHLMDCNPRNLPVFSMPPLPVKPDMSVVKDSLAALPLNRKALLSAATEANDYVTSSSATIIMPEETKKITMLGHSMNAISIQKGTAVTYRFSTAQEGEALLRIALIPTHPDDGGDIRFAVSIDGGKKTVFSLKEPFRSERWKKNVLRAQTLRDIPLVLEKGMHEVTISALDDHIVLDQWILDFDLSRRYYLIP